ncbi:MAG TPA: VTT domain-containing protein [Acidobacteriaceae bacterium]|nr:VTT domain-containing protein [Acidobacteriaceae bacterium]
MRTVRHRLAPAWIVHFGIAGVFVVAVLDTAPFPLPIPGSTDILILILGANGASPWLLAPAAIAGALLGGYLTWVAGKRGGEKMLDRYAPRRFRSRIAGWVKTHGVLSVCLSALLPPPIPLLPFLLAAGALGVTRKQLFIALGIARTIRYGTEAALAAYYGHRILRFWHREMAQWSTVILYSFLGIFAVAIVFWIWKYRHDRQADNAAQHAARAADGVA